MLSSTSVSDLLQLLGFSWCCLGPTELCCCMKPAVPCAREESVCIASAGHVEARAEKRQTGDGARLAWREWEKLPPTWEQADATRRCASLSSLWERVHDLPAQTHLPWERRGAKHLSLPMCLCTAVRTLQAAGGPQPWVRGDFGFNRSLQLPVG